MRKIIIVGGGTAGWMTACLFAKALGPLNIQIQLIESEQIGIIGVGEGSTPQLKQFFSILGITEEQWMPKCNATFKNGISFEHWSEHLTHNEYFHPFPSPLDQQTAKAFLYNTKLRTQGMDVNCRPNHYFLSAVLADNYKSPKTVDPKQQVPLNYAYHFDSTLLGEYLKDLGISLGVLHTTAMVDDIKLNADGEIVGLKLQDSQELTADFFVDATGFNSELLQKACGVKFISFADNLFNDAAIAIPTGLTNLASAQSSTKVKAQTTATALKNGWAWKIPLTNRYGNGYVFSQKHCDFDQAEQELKQHLSQNYAPKYLDSLTTKRLHMKVGQVEQHWHKNVLGVGLSQGFIEPLEATALHIVQETVLRFLECFKAGKFDENDRTRFNRNISERFEGIRDYIVCHYKVNSKSNSPYWEDNRNNPNISDNLAAVLEAWDSGNDIISVLNEKEMVGYYPAVSWFCLLAGYGRFKPAMVKNKMPNGQMQQLSNMLKAKQALFLNNLLP